ncbi:Smr/MutS family protein [Spongiivirga citrea]|uniref:DNA mismatch repair protein MutS n=1 Tax=Spongiivirga citrea TaxID=1481457 RepID=A0A6M0CET0_9FLAO|nr:Smr/MutS family protein [Spongiivirga citrea]NER16326.1 DNA mismatch repair protein MutS [Spongiivirga citrea]
MKFVVGDRVEALDDVISGIVQKIDGNTVTIETDEGFPMTLQSRELIKKQEGIQVSNAQVASIKKEKEIPKKPKSTKSRPKDRSIPAMEVDLHIHQLVANEGGMEPHDKLTLQLDTAKRQLEFAMRKRIQRIVFIHGVGEGVLKLELQYLFKHYDNVKFYDADYQKYGLGATEVYIYQNVKP